MSEPLATGLTAGWMTSDPELDGLLPETRWTDPPLDALWESLLADLYASQTFAPTIARHRPLIEAAIRAEAAALPTYTTVERLDRPGNRADGTRSAPALRPWLRHKSWCNVQTDDPPDTERCKCGLRAALRSLGWLDRPGNRADGESER